MRKFSEGYLNANYAATAAQIPWGHNMLLLDKVDDPSKRLWYAQQALKFGWSRSVLGSWIESDLYGRKGRAITNFKEILPPAQSDMAEQALKDPYHLQFVTLESAYREKELEQGLMNHLQKFLQEILATQSNQRQSWKIGNCVMIHWHPLNLICKKRLSIFLTRNSAKLFIVKILDRNQK